MNPLHESYPEARASFLDAAESAGFRTMRFRIANEEYPELFQDYALLRRNPKSFLLHLSGVHGVEGYLGSAIQQKFLSRDWPEDGPSILFVHAVNPYGMALYRRANAENVDLNRNFRKGPAAPNPDYAAFDSYLNPQNRLEFLTGPLKAFWVSLRFGSARTSQAVASGQVKFPRGLFYMGERVQREIFLLQEFLRAHCGEAEKAIVIDLHSGLGEFGSELLFVDHEKNADAPSYFSRIFSQEVATADPAKGFYKNQGPLFGALNEALPQTKVFYVLQEFGAKSATRTLNALRKENFEWHRRPLGSIRPDKISNSMLEAFFPRDLKWRESVVQKGVDRLEQSLQALSTELEQN